MAAKTIIIAAVPNILSQSPAFRKTTVPGAPNGNTNNRSLLGKSSLIKREMIETSLESTTRKRQRLDHLSLEEKLLRRKLKNRVAAQTARDRKKAKMEELEDLVQHLEFEREILKAENSKLKNMNMLLETENKYLKGKSNDGTEVELEEKNGSESFEHASFINAPLLKDQDLTIRSSLSTKHLIFWQMMTTLMISWIYSKNAKNSSKTFLEMAPRKTKINKMHLPYVKKSQMMSCGLQQNSLNRNLIWWGPKQKMWAPQKDI